MAKLGIIASTDRPIREEKHRRIWLLHKNKDTVLLHISHDAQERPFVLNKGVA